MSCCRRLRRSTSARTACAMRARWPGMPSVAGSGSSSVAGSVAAAIASAWNSAAGQVRRRRAGRTPLAQVEVVGHLGHQVADALDQHRAGVVVARGAEREQHLLAEAVRRGDGRGVEDRECLLEQLAPYVGELRGRASASCAQDAVVVGDGGRVGQAVAGADQPLADPLPQLAGRLAAEADDEQLLHRDPVGDVARDQVGDGEGLAGAGAGLQHRGALGQRAEQVERLRRAPAPSPVALPTFCGSATGVLGQGVAGA